MKLIKAFVICSLLFVSASCTRQELSQRIYEGVRLMNRMETTPPEQVGKPEFTMDYNQYEVRLEEMRNNHREPYPFK